VYAKLTAALRPSLRRWIDGETKRVVNDPRITEADVTAGAPSILGMSAPKGDIMALVFIVLMNSTKDMDEDLKATMAQVKAMNEAKLMNKIKAMDEDLKAINEAKRPQRESTHTRSRQEVIEGRRSRFIGAITGSVKVISPTQNQIVERFK
jgi:hypothetical protein